MQTFATQSSFNLQDWQKGYQSQTQESEYWIDDVEGEIPPELTGTLFRNGPGLLDINGQQYHHPFDGDGMICAIAFDGGRAHFRNRFVRTSGFVAEQAAGKILYRGVFGTQKPGGWWANFLDLKQKNIANTNVIYWGGKLLALWEADVPYRLNPENLDTIGLDRLDGILGSGDVFSAHPRVDLSGGEDNPVLVNFGIKPGLSTRISLYELDKMGKLLDRSDRIIPGFAFIHDFAITPNFRIFLQNAVDFNPLPYLLGFKGAGQCINFQSNRPAKIWIVPRRSSEPMQVLETQAGFVFHHANAFEADGAIYLDSICYESLPTVEANSDYRQTDFSRLSPGQLWRFKLDLDRQKVAPQILLSRCCEFPAIHPSKMGVNYRYVYIGAADASQGNAPLQAILKLDLATQKQHLWSAAPQGFVSEPLFIPRSSSGGEDDGWVMTLVYDASCHCSALVILDGRDLNMVATLRLKHHIPYGLHGSWTSEKLTAES
jgi:all-trans-8'-apo-beta-carotenal 15,15'-oxygenase